MDTPELRHVPPTALRPHEQNPRLITAERFRSLVKRLREEPTMMWARPIIALRDGRIIAGSTRYRACSELG